MLRSLSSGVSGLRNQQVKLDVIGNNIANVNTAGYKARRVNFQDQFAQTLRGGSAPANGLGGTNPSQVGLGVTVGSIDLDMTQGALLPTGKNTDLAISGEGFFCISDGKQIVFTRDGAFDFDRNGNMVKISNGYRVMGWNATLNPMGQFAVDPSRPIEEITVPAGTTLTPQATANVSIGGNLEAQTPVDVTTMASVNMFDSQGNQLKGRVVYTRVAPLSDNTWQVDFQAENPDDFTVGAMPVPIGRVKFDQRGVLAEYQDAGGGIITVPGSTTVTNWPAITLTPTSGQANPLEIQFSVGTTGQSKGLTQYVDRGTDLANQFYNSTAVMADQDGYTSGVLTGVSVDNSGVITGVFTNGRTRVMGQVALATFTNPVGLQTQGNNVYSTTANSGEPQIGPANSGARGSIQPGALEGSNVDLAASFSDLIIAQRGLQSNSKIITTSDEVLQELMALKR